jgi:hypothetical protein
MTAPIELPHDNTTKGLSMNTTTRTLKRTITAALLSGGVAVAGLGLGAGTAQADAFGNHQWCPGQTLPQADAPITWDMGICHDWHYQSVRDGAPSLYHIVEGVYPNPCPPLAFLCP